MKTAGILIGMVILLFSVQVARAADHHVVRSGENLSKICAKYGVNWQDTAKRNKIRPPYIIHPGQKILLAGQVAESGRRRYWDNPGGDPLNGWSLDKMKKAVDLSSMPEEARAKAKALVGTTKWRTDYLYKGQVLDQMFFGNYRTWENVEVRLARYDQEKVSSTFYDPFIIGDWEYHTGFSWLAAITSGGRKSQSLG
jgi:LysM repeat protein